MNSKLKNTDSLILRTVAKHNGNLVKAAKELDLNTKMVKSVIERNAYLYSHELRLRNEEHLKSIDTILEKVWDVIPKNIDAATPKEIAFILKALMDARAEVKPPPVEIKTTSTETSYESLSEEDRATLDGIIEVEESKILQFDESLVKEGNSQALPGLQKNQKKNS